MAKVEHLRDRINEFPDAAFLRKRNQEGWKLAAIEWVRESKEFVAAPEGETAEEIPYGLRIASDCWHLEVDEEEYRAMTLMMEQIVLDNPLSEVAKAVNNEGLRTRDGLPWDRVSVFNMLPRLIEVGPRMFSSEEWQKRRRSLFKVA